MAKALVTGFEPFGGERMNPAWEAVRRLPDTIDGTELLKLEVPVTFAGAPAAVQDAIERYQPDVVLCVGQAGGRAVVTPEFVGINYADARIPDNAGAQPRAQRIDPGGPDAYFSTLPVAHMAEAMRAAGVPAEVSYSAGTYVCNTLLYATLGYIAKSGRSPTGKSGEEPVEKSGAGEKASSSIRAGFVHVPYAPEQVADRGGHEPSMSIETMARGLEAGLGAILQRE